ncbi:MAG: hypothetical protein IKZ14_00670 [Muribaculaceae bacterium]|nr:hypothetical protein [Muribaculaceae bacterium]
MNKFEITTRIMSQPNGSGKLKLTIKNGWSFWNWMYVENTESIRNYLKSDEFKEFACSVFSKFEGMTYEEMHNTDRKPDFHKIWEKLDRFAWRAVEEEPFKINMSVKLIRTYRNGFRYRVVFGNNKNNAQSYRRKTQMGYFLKEEAYWDLGKKQNLLNRDKELNDKLATYNSWDEFNNDFLNKNDISNMVDKCLAA